jgi:nitrite reductase/ring-hydroxylating ferredoxin subunit
MEKKILPRSFLQRVLGICATTKPADVGAWSYSGNKVSVDLDRVPELARPGTAVRLEGGPLPVKVLLLYGDDGQFRAFKNRCTHLGHRRLDPVPGAKTVQCCSVNKTTYGYDGKNLFGPGKRSLTQYPLEKKGSKVVISL